MKKLLVMIALLGFAGCGTFSGDGAQRLNPQVYYKQDIKFTYETGKEERVKIKNFFKRFKRGKYRKTKLVREKLSFRGVGVLPQMEEYNIEVQAHGKLNFFALTTCHEETTSENPDSGWRKKKGYVGFTYKPTIERGKACPLYVSSYSRKQKHGWGILAFEDERYKLPATVHCNGIVEEYGGVSICQSREKLLQRITFKEPVKLLPPVTGAADRKLPCPVIGEDGQSSYEFLIPGRECIYGFIGRNSKQVHQFMTIGYEDIIIRE